jgi:hypothetical protein
LQTVDCTKEIDLPGGKIASSGRYLQSDPIGQHHQHFGGRDI